MVRLVLSIGGRLSRHRLGGLYVLQHTCAVVQALSENLKPFIAPTTLSSSPPVAYQSLVTPFILPCNRNGNSNILLPLILRPRLGPQPQPSPLSHL